MVEDIKKGDTLQTIAQNHSLTFIKYHGGAKSLISLLCTKKRQWRTELHIYTGAPGTGKSYTARQEALNYISSQGLDEEPYYLMLPTKGAQLWWQDYNGQSVVILDDFYGEGLDIDYFKRMIDEYPFKINIKNGSGEFLAKRVYVTSNTGWKNWWGTALINNIHNTKAIERRITVEKTFTEEYTPLSLSQAPTQHINIDETPLSPLGRAYANAGYIGDLLCSEDDEEVMAHARAVAANEYTQADFELEQELQ